MTDRYNFLTVVLEKDMRSDDAEQLINAIKQLRNVLDVKPNVSNGYDTTAELRARDKLQKALLSVIYQ